MSQNSRRFKFYKFAASDFAWAKKGGFSLHELLICLIILALLVFFLAYFGYYLTLSAQSTVSVANAKTLNDALDRYKLNGGMLYADSLEGDNTPEKINNVVSALETGFTADGFHQAFVDDAISTAGLTATGRGIDFHFQATDYPAGASSSSGKHSLPLTSDSLSFGNVAIGSSATRNLSIENANDQPLTVTSISTPQDYSPNWSSGTINAGDTKNVAVTYTPSGVSQSGGGLITIDTTTPTSSVVVPVNGNGIGAVVSMNGNLAFGNQALGTVAQHAFAITNSGTTAMTVNAISTPSGFSTNWSSGTIQPNATQSVAVSFAPVALQDYGGNVTVASNAAAGTNTIPVSGHGAESLISLSGDLSFGTQLINTSVTGNVSINNSGTLPLNVSSISLPTGFSADWTSGTVAAGGAKNVNVTFTPTNIESYDGTLAVNSNATTGDGTIAVTGSGGQPMLSLSGTLNFGSVALNSTATASLTVSNSGTTPLTINSVTLPSGYTANWTSTTIAPGDSQTMVVSFTPTSTQTYSGNVVISSDSANGNATTWVSGSGINNTINMSISGNLNFPDVPLGETGSATLTIDNTGNTALTVSSITLPSGFTADWTSGTVPAGSSQNVTVTFTPTSAQSYDGVLTINANNTSGTNTFAISANGVADTHVVSLTGTLNFGAVAVGYSATASFTIGNTGNTPLTVNSISLPTGFSADWTAGVINPGSSQTVNVTFTPTLSQSYNGTLVVNSDSTSGDGTLPLIGSGNLQTKVVSLSGNLTFGTVPVGYTASASCAISNYGNTPLTVTSISLPTGYTADWNSGTIVAGGTQIVNVTFAPTSAQSYNGSLTVNCDSTSGTNTMAITGSGATDTRVISIDGGPCNFGDVAIGILAPPTVILTIHNSGNSPLTVSSITMPCVQFSANWNAGVIPAGGSQNVTVSFAPTGIQIYSGNIVVNSDATSGTNTVSVLGVGINL